MKKIVSFISGIILALFILLIPIKGLDFQAKSALATLALAIVWWIFKVFHDFVTAILMGVLFVLTTEVPMETVCSGFSSPTWWLLFSAFGLSLGVSKCGILKRVSHKMLSFFPHNFLGQVMGLIVVGFISAPLIPSLSAKAAILAPLSMGISDSMGYVRKSKQATGLFLAALTGLRTPAPLFISASVIGYTLCGQYSDEIVRQFSMLTWFISALPWFLIVTALTSVSIYLICRPSKEEEVAYRQDDFHSEVFQTMKRDEKIMLAIISITLLFWATENQHGIPAHIVAMLALTFMLISNIISPQEILTQMNWDSMIFLGFAFGIAPVFNALYIDTWLIGIFMPIISLFSFNHTGFLICIAVATILLRVLIVSEVAYINIAFVFLLPLAESLGINPWIIGITVYAVISPWFFLYQNPVYMAAYHATNMEMVRHRDMATFCMIYLVICIFAIIISVPYWIKMGVFYM